MLTPGFHVYLCVHAYTYTHTQNLFQNGQTGLSSFMFSVLSIRECVY